MTVSGGGKVQVFNTGSGVTASLSGMTITGGHIENGNGGGLFNDGTATLTDVPISGNSASFFGFGTG